MSGMTFLISEIDMKDLEENSQRFLMVLDGLAKVKPGEKLKIVEKEKEDSPIKKGGSWGHSPIEKETTESSPIKEEKEDSPIKKGGSWGHSPIFEVDTTYFQSVFRWFYGQNRLDIHDKLSHVLEDYFKFLNMLDSIYKNDKNSTDPKRENMLKIMDIHAEFSKNCINGLNNLCETYNENELFKDLYKKYINSF